MGRSHRQLSLSMVRSKGHRRADTEPEPHRIADAGADTELAKSGKEETTV